MIITNFRYMMWCIKESDEECGKTLRCESNEENENE